MASLEDAIALAAKAHEGVKDKGGQPYIFHPLRVMLNCFPYGDVAAKAAVLHDVVEDTDVTIKQLAEQFGYDVSNIVEFVTKKDGESYFDFIVRCSKNPVAKLVKIADVMDNMSRIDNIKDEAKRNHLQDRYTKALLRMMV